MATVFISEDRLTAIGEAIREKTGDNELLKVADMPAAIQAIETGGGGGEGIPEEAFILTGDNRYKFEYDSWAWFLQQYKNKIKTNKLKNCSYMFSYAKSITELPFDFNFDLDQIPAGINMSYMFSNCSVKTIGKITAKLSDASAMFSNASYLRELPELEFDFTEWHKVSPYYTCKGQQMFQGCMSLRHIPEDILKELYINTTSGYSLIYSYGFNLCASLDEIKGLPVVPTQLTSNAFTYTFNDCSRVKDIIFDTDNGQPKVAQWKNQLIDLSQFVGFRTANETYIWQYNSGITQDKRVTNDDQYQALKNDPDWYSFKVEYSRYNHDSAVNTINSLPDTSAYGTNTIRFLGNAGSATDGGAINTLTAEEIAVAAAKGWTVSLV